MRQYSNFTCTQSADITYLISSLPFVDLLATRGIERHISRKVEVVETSYTYCGMHICEKFADQAT